MSKSNRLNGAFVMVPLEIATDPEMSDAAIRAFVVIQSHSNGETGEAFPSIERVAHLMGCSRSKAKRAIYELIEKSVLKREGALDERGGYASNTYSLHPRFTHDPRDGSPVNLGMGHTRPEGRSTSDPLTRRRELETKELDKENQRPLSKSEEKNLGSATDILKGLR